MREPPHGCKGRQLPAFSHHTIGYSTKIARGEGMIKRAAIVVAGWFLAAAPLLCQDGPWEVSLNVPAVLSKHSQGNGTLLTPTQTIGVVGSLGLRLSRRTSLEGSFGHARNSQNYASGGANYRIQATVTEFSGALVVRAFQAGKFRPFVLGGAGGLVFNPNATFIDDNAQNLGAVRQTRVGFLYGAGLDYGLVSRFSLRLQYRGLVYSAPDFKVQNLFTSSRGHLAEPSLGIVFTF
jgi:outer membrane immunogenic protein